MHQPSGKEAQEKLSSLMGWLCHDLSCWPLMMHKHSWECLAAELDSLLELVLLQIMTI